MLCSICLREDNTTKVNCCKKHFHKPCLHKWLMEGKFTCPNCRDDDAFLTSLPYQKLKMVPMFSVDESNHWLLTVKEQYKLRYEITKEFDKDFRRCMLIHTSSKFFQGKLMIHSSGRPLTRARVKDLDFFFFEYNESKIALSVSFWPTDQHIPFFYEVKEM